MRIVVIFFVGVALAVAANLVVGTVVSVRHRLRLLFAEMVYTEVHARAGHDTDSRAARGEGARRPATVRGARDAVWIAGTGPLGYCALVLVAAACAAAGGYLIAQHDAWGYMPFAAALVVLALTASLNRSTLSIGDGVLRYQRLGGGRQEISRASIDAARPTPVRRLGVVRLALVLRSVDGKVTTWILPVVGASAGQAYRDRVRPIEQLLQRHGIAGADEPAAGPGPQPDSVRILGTGGFGYACEVFFAACFWAVGGDALADDHGSGYGYLCLVIGLVPTIMAISTNRRTLTIGDGVLRYRRGARPALELSCDRVASAVLANLRDGQGMSHLDLGMYDDGGRIAQWHLPFQSPTGRSFLRRSQGIQDLLERHGIPCSYRT